MQFFKIPKGVNHSVFHPNVCGTKLNRWHLYSYFPFALYKKEEQRKKGSFIICPPGVCSFVRRISPLLVNSISVFDPAP